MVRRIVKMCIFLGLSSLGVPNAHAQEHVDTLRVVKIGDTYRPIDDTTTIYHLGAVIVGSRLQRIPSANTFQQITLASIDQMDAVKMSELAPVIPSGYVQTNSRGESLLYLRNTGERQLALFFDGALLNIPWDNRIDLDLIPTNALGSLSVSKGAASIAYGANVMGGAVNMISRSLSQPGSFTEIDANAGNAGRFDVSAVQLGKSESLEYAASVGYYAQDGVPLSRNADLPFSQTDPDIRTNTDMKRFNAFARGAYSLDSGVTVSLSAAYIDAEKGIAPEGQKDPATTGSIRYWRYPDWRNLTMIAGIGSELGEDRNTAYRGAIWLNNFDQRIVSYESVAYETPESTQDDSDRTLGGRFVLKQQVDASEIRVSVNATHSRHNEVTREDDGELDQTFGQVLGSAGIEADFRPGGLVWYSASANVDVQVISDADVFEKPDPNVELGGMLGFVFQASARWTLRASAGRKSRFPTMRERYADALGRFVVNPDLGSEQAILTEIGARYSKRAVSVEVVGFANFTTDTIDQDVTEVHGATKRIRVNLEGSRSLGVELNASIRLVQELLLEANGMLNYLRAEDAETGRYDRRLTERPNSIASVRGTYNHRQGITAGLAIVFAGEAFSLDDSGEYVSLSPSTQVDARAGYRFQVGRANEATIELFARVNNAFDVVVENQLGLPGPGRAVVAGTRIGL